MNTNAGVGSHYGGQGVALLRTLAEQTLSTFTVTQAREVARTVGIADSYLTILLHRLQRAGWLQRIKHGTYALTTGLSGFPEAHPFALGMALVVPCAVSGWAALNYHGLTEQIPRVITLTTSKRVVTPAMRGVVRTAPSIWQVAGQQFEIVSVKPTHFFGYEQVWMGQSQAQVFDRERALLDCFAFPRWFGGLAEGLGIIEEHLHELDLPRLVTHIRQYGKAVVAKRIGYTLEHSGVDSGLVESLQTLPMHGVRLLDPTRPSRGTTCKRWGLVENLAAPRKRS